MNLLSMTEAESWAVNHILAGSVADLSSFGQASVIRAEIIRALLLRITSFRTDNGHPFPLKAPSVGIYIRNAIIRCDSGWLNLENGALDDGSDLPHLSLDNCKIECNINLKSTHIRGLSLKNSAIRLVDADHARINGLLDICFLRPLIPDDGAQGKGFCRLSLRGAHITGGLDARGAKLACEPKRSDFIPYVKRARYALDLPQARIIGDVRLFPNFEAIGGVNINNAKIVGALQAHGAYFSNEEEDYALHAKGVEITGKVSLDSHDRPPEDDSLRPPYSNFTSRGSIHLENAIFGNGLEMKGANIDGPINASNISIHGDVNLSTYSTRYGFTPFTCNGKIGFYGSKIHGDVNLSGAQLKRIERPEIDTSLDLSSSKIEGAVILSTWYSKFDKSRMSFYCDSTVKLDHSTISNDLCLNGAKIYVDVCPSETIHHEEPQLDDRCLAINASGLKLGGYALIGIDIAGSNGLLHTPRDALKFEARGDIVFDNAEIGFDFDMTSARIDGHIVARNLKVGGKLKMCVPEKEKLTASDELRKDNEKSLKFFCTKRISLSGAEIQSDFDLSGAELQRGLRFRGGIVKSALIINIDGGKDVRLQNRDNQDIPSHKSEVVVSKSSIDLTNAKVFILSDHDGTKTLYGCSFILRLEGFRYDRFRSVRDEESLIRQNDFQLASVKDSQVALLDQKKYIKKNRGYSKNVDRKKWLRMQYEFHDQIKKNVETIDNYSPDPYITLYKALRSIGSNIESDGIIIHKNNIETRLIYGDYKSYIGVFFIKYFFALLVSSMRKLFNIYSGYGLRLGRSTFFYVLYISILCGWIYIGEHGPNISFHKPPNFGYEFSHDSNLFLILKNDNAPPKACNGAINPLLFAVEMVIPTLNLGQKSTCEFNTNSGWVWQISYGFLTLLGWLMTSLLVLTWSGFYRRQIEP